MSVKRYDWKHTGGMTEIADGDYVTYGDYEKLSEELDLCILKLGEITVLLKDLHNSLSIRGYLNGLAELILRDAITKAEETK